MKHPLDKRRRWPKSNKIATTVRLRRPSKNNSGEIKNIQLVKVNNWIIFILSKYDQFYLYSVPCICYGCIGFLGSVECMRGRDKWSTSHMDRYTMYIIYIIYDSFEACISKDYRGAFVRAAWTKIYCWKWHTAVNQYKLHVRMDSPVREEKLGWN